MDATQQWELVQPGTYEQPPMMLGMEMGVPQQWEWSQPPTNAWTPATAQSALMMAPMAQQADSQASNWPVHGAQACQSMVAAGFNASGADWPSHMLAAGMPGHATESGHLQPMPRVHSSESMRPFVVLVPFYAADPSMGQPPMPQDSVNATLPSCIDMSLAGCQEPQSTESGVSTPAETYLCTPELTPRYAPEITPQPPRQGLLPSLPIGLQPNMLLDVATQLAELQDQPELLEEEDSEDEFQLPGSGNPADDLIEVEWHRCWDMIPRDSKNYASSDTVSTVSTVVSRSARRRRGRRSAKAKASKSSMPISEPPSPNDLLVTEENKNELIQKLLVGGNRMHKIVSSLHGSVLKLSLEPFGCRVVQSALDVANTAEKEGLAAELRGHVRTAITSPNANFVVQKVIEVLPVNSARFVAEELATFAAEVARHRFGCRVLSRLIEHSSSSTNNLIDELLLEADELINHNFARHVLELILEHGEDEHKHKIADVVRSNLFLYAKNRNASYVVEKALALCKSPDTRAIASELLTDPQRFLMLAVHECGTHVVKAVMQVHGEYAEKAKTLLLSEVDLVKSSKYGKRLLEEM